jgi:hypothetical protein
MLMPFYSNANDEELIRRCEEMHRDHRIVISFICFRTARKNKTIEPKGKSHSEQREQNQANYISYTKYSSQTYM